jgi:hypothetical protein
MEAVVILEELARLGVTVRVMGPKLLLEPGSKVPADLVGEVKACKVEFWPCWGGARTTLLPPASVPFPLAPQATPGARCASFH